MEEVLMAKPHLMNDILYNVKNNHTRINNHNILFVF
jgi:hypothetical protein